MERVRVAAEAVRNGARDGEAAAHPRERLPEEGALIARRGDRLRREGPHRIASSPSVTPAARLVTRSSASRTPAAKASRDVVS